MSPRQLAFEILSRGTKKPGGAAQLLDEKLATTALSGSERALTLELVHGVIRRQGTLDALLARHVNRPVEKVEAGARTLLHLGIYQLVLLSGAPPYAVVNETTELARKLGKPQWTGFINGVLRSAARTTTDEFSTEPSATAVPLADGRHRVLHERVFSDPELDFAAYFAAAFSFPLWLVERWHRRIRPEDLTRMGFWFNAPPRLTLRVNELRVTRDDFLVSLSQAGISARPGAHPASIRLEQTARVPDLPGFAEGWFTVQDESAMGAATLLAPKPEESILDLCAAPGGKSCHLATIMRNQGKVLAVDVDEERLALIGETSRRLGLTIVEPRLAQRDSRDVPAGPFDAILMDVPCSNTGVLGKRPEARWRVTPGDLVELVELQRRLLTVALERLNPGGRLVYSTCSIEPEENQGLVQEVIAGDSRLRLVEEHGHVPGAPADGGYQALLVRR